MFADKLQADEYADYIMAQLDRKFYHVEPTQIPEIDLETTQIILKNTPYGSKLGEFFVATILEFWQNERVVIMRDEANEAWD